MSLEDLRIEAEAEVKKLASDLKKVETKEDLIKLVPRLRSRFNRIADLLIEVRPFADKSAEPSLASERLFVELARLYEIPGAQEILESAERDAVRRLSRRR